MRRPWLARGVLVAAALLPAPAPAHANLLPDFYVFSERPAAVQLGLGSVLFHFYQDDHAATLAEALYVEARFLSVGEEPTWRHQLVLAKGSAALALGMVASARNWLASIDPAALPPRALPRLHLALARIAYLDGEDARALEMLARLPEEDAARPEVRFLRAELARRAGDLAGMRTALASLEPDQPLWFFGWHNYAIAALRAGDRAAALASFEQLAATRPDSPIAADVVVRAGVQSALLRAEDGDVPGAIERLDRVPVAGRYGRLALARRAQLALVAADFRTAGKVYEALAAPSDGRWDDERVDALIGSAYLRERTTGATAAAVAFARARDALASRVDSLRALDTALVGQDWLPQLATIEQARRAPPVDVDDEDDLRALAIAEELQALANAEQASDEAGWTRLSAQLGGVDWLAWFATNAAQRELAAWRRLRTAQARVRLLDRSSSALGEVAAEADARVARAAVGLGEDGVRDGLATADHAVRERAAQLAAWRAAEQLPAEALRALATPSEAEQWRQLDSVTARLDRLGSNAASARLAPMQARLARLQGVLGYAVDSERAERIWARHKQLRATLDRTQQLSIRAGRLDGAERDRSEQRGADARVAQLRERLQSLLGAIGEARGERERLLTATLRERVDDDRRQSERQLAYARLALARLEDAAAFAGAAVSAAPAVERPGAEPAR